MQQQQRRSITPDPAEYLATGHRHHPLLESGKEGFRRAGIGQRLVSRRGDHLVFGPVIVAA
jgi:hypothetical protein